MICPQCRSANCFRSHRGGPLDFVGTLAGMRPWRCLACEGRFHAWLVPFSFSGYVHCPRCGNFDLQVVSRELVKEGTFVFLKRLLSFPAYRCDPCRQRFFSVRRFRRILPLMSPAGPDEAARAAN
jgi:hypothetical protein